MKKFFLAIAAVAVIFSACSKGEVNNGGDESPKYDCKISVQTSTEEIGIRQVLDISYSLSKPATEYYMEDEDGDKIFNQKELEWFPIKLGNNKLKFVASNGSEEVVEYKTIKVVPCDMGTGRWGNSTTYIKRCEKNSLETNSSGMLRYKTKGGELIYQFDGDKLNRGHHTSYYEYTSSIQSNAWLCLDLFSQILNGLKKEYGEPVSYTDDIYSFTRKIVNEPGDILYEGQRINNGGHEIRYVFESDRTTVECILQKKRGSSYARASQSVIMYRQK